MIDEVRPRLLGDAVDAGWRWPRRSSGGPRRRGPSGPWRPPRPRGRSPQWRASSPVSAGSTSPVTASNGRPIEPGWAMMPIVVTRAGSESTSSRTRRVLPMPGSPETSATAGCSDVITSAASTIPARRANGRARPIMIGLIPTRPLSTASTLEAISGWRRVGSATPVIGSLARPAHTGPRLPTAAAAGSPEAERSGDTLVVTAGGALLPGRWEEDERGRWALGARLHVAMATEEGADAGRTDGRPARGGGGGDRSSRRRGAGRSGCSSRGACRS